MDGLSFRAELTMKWPSVFIVFSRLLILLVAGDETAKMEKISGGGVVRVESYPFMVALLRQTDHGQLEQTCGGTIVTSSAVLTAASCFHNGNTEDAAGQWRARVGSNFSNAGGTVHFIREVTSHPSFNAQTREHDVAVARVTVPFTFRSEVAAASLAGAAYTLETYQQVWALGWGSAASQSPGSKELSAVQIWVEDRKRCGNRYMDLGFTLTDTMICAGWIDVGIRGQCQGDTGSPLLHNGAVVGVFSYAEGCVDPWFPGINTLVGPYVNWVVDTALHIK